VSIALAFSAQTEAQTARQGTEKADPTEFHSPMVLETEFVAAKPTLWQEKGPEDWVRSPEYSNLRRYHCDGVSISDLQLSPFKSGSDRITTRIALRITNTGHDKQVKLLLELVNGEKKVAESTLGPFKDKEGATVEQIGTIEVARSALLTDPITKLRITMTNWDY
jgi:hypothetical protein